MSFGEEKEYLLVHLISCLEEYSDINWGTIFGEVCLKNETKLMHYIQNHRQELLISPYYNYILETGIEGACKGGHLAIVEHLYKEFKHESTFVCPSFSDSVVNHINIAIKQGHAPIVKYLLTKLEDKSLIYKCLSTACEYRQVECLKLILSLHPSCIVRASAFAYFFKQALGGFKIKNGNNGINGNYILCQIAKLLLPRISPDQLLECLQTATRFDNFHMTAILSYMVPHQDFMEHFREFISVFSIGRFLNYFQNGKWKGVLNDKMPRYSLMRRLKEVQKGQKCRRTQLKLLLKRFVPFVIFKIVIRPYVEVLH